MPSDDFIAFYLRYHHLTWANDYRLGQRFFNMLPLSVSTLIVRTPLDPFNWNDERFQNEYHDLCDRILAHVIKMERAYNL